MPAQELHVPALLEILAVPYSGASPKGMAICYDKQIVRLVAGALDVPVPREICLEPDRELPALADLYPALIKPNQGDGSVGITKDAVVRSEAEAQRYVAWLRRELPGRALPAGVSARSGVRRRADRQSGSRLEALPVLEVDFSGLPAGLAPILSLESKTLPDSLYWTEIRFRRAEADALLARMVGHTRPVRAARLPRLRAVRLPLRRRWRAQAARGQPQPRLGQRRQARVHGRVRRHRVSGHAEVDPGRALRRVAADRNA